LKYFFAGPCVIGLCLAAMSAQATTVTINFGSGTGVFSPWLDTSDASNSTGGVVLTSPLLLDGGILEITASGGSLECDRGVTADTCGTSTGLTTSTAYGLGVGNGRINGSETITLTLLDSAYDVSLTSFGLTGFSQGEAATYTIDGTPHRVDAPFTNVAFDTYTVGTDFTTVVWSVPPGNDGNYSLADITLNVTPSSVPEPATLGLVGLALVGLSLLSRRIASRS
jgi:hypothetical protein